MKWFIASDLHGSAYWVRKMIDRYEQEQADRILLLGDILYHGPRNDLPKEYAPKEVIAMLSPLKNKIYAVRGNCEAEVDQMVLPFPVMADYCVLPVTLQSDPGENDGETVTKAIYATHGHVYNDNHLPPLMPGDILLHGHTHLYRADKIGDNLILNPGSVSLAKGGNVNTYAVLENGIFTIKDMDGKVILSQKL